MTFANGTFRGIASREKVWHVVFGGGYNNLSISERSGNIETISLHTKFYRFAIQNTFPRPESQYLLPPSGSNLLSLLVTHKELRTVVNQLFTHYGLRLVLKPQEGKIEVIKQLEDIIIAYPYTLVSDTLQRMVFYQAAILSNKDSILAFEEPESHAFPYYTKQLAEMIAFDESNQYFITTHNPYFLGPVLEKSHKEDVAVFIVYFEDYQTKVRPLSSEEIEEIMEIDVFSNLDRYLVKK